MPSNQRPSFQNGMIGTLFCFRITERSTAFRRRFMAVPWRRTCGDTRFVFSDGHFVWAVFECIYRDMNRTRGNRRIARNVAMVATVLGLWEALVLLFAAPL